MWRSAAPSQISSAVLPLSPRFVPIGTLNESEIRTRVVTRLLAAELDGVGVVAARRRELVPLPVHAVHATEELVCG